MTGNKDDIEIQLNLILKRNEIFGYDTSFSPPDDLDVEKMFSHLFGCLNRG